MIIMYLSLIGMVLGIIDVLPMIKKQLDKYSTVSAFVYHMIMPFVVYYSAIEMHFILKGGLLYLLISLPIVILVLKDEKKAVPIILCMSTFLGVICGAVIHFLL